jgi:hypothetical protein
MNQSEEDRLIIHDLSLLLKELEDVKTMDDLKALLERSKALMGIYLMPEDLR